MKLCKNKSCSKRAITCSDFCGEHTTNDSFARSLSSIFNNQEEQSFNDCYISEIELNHITICNKNFSFLELSDCNFKKVNFKNCRFENCHFNDIEFLDSSFELCSFFDCEIDQLFLSGCTVYNSAFKQSHFANSSITDETTLIKANFKLCNFSNTDFWSISSADKSKFYQCIFVHSSINGSCFDNSHFKHIEFSKTSIAYNSFIGCEFIDITDDFNDIGGPNACNFYKASFDKTFMNSIGNINLLNNIKYEKESVFVLNSIKNIFNFHDAEYISELNYFLNKYKKYGSIINLKNDVHSFYKSLYQKAIDTNDAQLAGSIINGYTHLPEEIRINLLQLSSPAANENIKGAYALIEFYTETHIKFHDISYVNNMLSEIAIHLVEEEKFDVISIRKGSVIETLYGHTSDILLFISSLYAVSRAVLSIIKNGFEIKKLSLETKQIELQNKKLSDEIQIDEINKRTREFTDAIKESYIIPDAIFNDLEKQIHSIPHNKTCISKVNDLDKRYRIKKVEIRIKT